MATDSKKHSLSSTKTSLLDLPNELLYSIAEYSADLPDSMVWEDQFNRPTTLKFPNQTVSSLSLVCRRMVGPGRCAFYRHINLKRKNSTRFFKEFPDFSTFHGIIRWYTRTLQLDCVFPGIFADLIKGCPLVTRLVVHWSTPIPQEELETIAQSLGSLSQLEELDVGFEFSRLVSPESWMIEALGHLPPLKTLCVRQPHDFSLNLDFSRLISLALEYTVIQNPFKLFGDWVKNIKDSETRLSLQLFDVELGNQDEDALEAIPILSPFLVHLTLDRYLAGILDFKNLHSLVSLRSLTLADFVPTLNELGEIPNFIHRLSFNDIAMHPKFDEEPFELFTTLEKWLTDHDIKDSPQLQRLEITFFEAFQNDGGIYDDKKWEDTMSSAVVCDRICQDRGIITAPTSFERMIEYLPVIHLG